MRLIAATLFALLALVSPAFATPVTDVTVDNGTPTNAAGARTSYVVGFKATNGVANGDTISVTFAVGAAFSGWAGGTVNVGAAPVGNCGSPSNSVILCTLFSGRTIAAADSVTVTLNGVTNPGNGANTLSVRTTKDADAVTAPFTVAAAGRLTQITLDNTTPSGAAGARTRYLAAFKVSATGGMSQQANSRINVLFPPGTSYLGWAGGVISVAGVDVGNCASPSNGTVQCSLFSGRTIAPNSTVQLALNGVANTTEVGQRTIGVDTTSDPASLPSAPFTVADPHVVSGVTLVLANPSNAAGARTTYVVGFTTSATGGLAQEANSRISVAFQSDTTFQGWAGATVSVGATAVGNCGSPSGLLVECTLFSGRTIAPNTAVSIAFTGVTNPSTAGAKKLGVSTTSDAQPVESTTADVVGAGSLSAVTVANGAPTAAAGARTRYVLGFTASATGGLSQEANSRIDVTFPPGTTFPGWSGATVSVGATQVGNCGSPNGLAVQCTLFSGRTIAAGAAVSIAFGGVTNPSTPGLDKAVTISTTSDPKAQASAAFAVSGVNQVSGISVAVASLEPSARTRYVVRFDASVTGALAQEANSRIDLTLPGGTTFAGWSGGTVRDETTGVDVGNCSSPNGLAIQCSLFSGRTVAVGHTLRITFDNITNPASTGPYRLSVSTTSDPTAVASANYSQGDPLPSDPTPEPTTSPDPTPAAIATSVPTATATPAPTVTPTPEPEFKKDVVAAPASGTIEVCDKPGGSCHKLAAGERVRLKRTIDARKGVVVLSSIGADGKVETAKFSEGMFKVSQSATTTDLTLNEPLAPCAGKKASSSAKKPKSRKLWGDGKGKFRTKGSYSAATIRGTKWLVQDSCAGTLTRVTQGVVSVRDDVRKKTITLRAGKRYTAKPR